MTASITVTVNDEPRDLSAGTSCRDLVAAVTGCAVGDDGRPADGSATGLGVALALDGEVVPRTRWAATAISDGAKLELVTAVQGG